MNSREMLDQMARNARYPVIPRVRIVRGETAGPWVILGAYPDRTAATNAVSHYMQAHAVQGGFQGSILEFSHPDYIGALAQVRQTRLARSRTRSSRSTRSR